MKNLGIVRRIDDLGRIVIPKDARKQLNIQEGDAMEIWLDDNNNIVLKPYEDIENLINERLDETIACLDELKSTIKNTSNIDKIQEVIDKIIDIENEFEN